MRTLNLKYQEILSKIETYKTGTLKTGEVVRIYTQKGKDPFIGELCSMALSHQLFVRRWSLAGRLKWIRATQTTRPFSYSSFGVTLIVREDLMIPISVAYASCAQYYSEAMFFTRKDQRNKGAGLFLVKEIEEIHRDAYKERKAPPLTIWPTHIAGSKQLLSKSKFEIPVYVNCY